MATFPPRGYPPRRPVRIRKKKKRKKKESKQERKKNKKKTRKQKNKKKNLEKTFNEAIRAREVRAIFPDGAVEIMPTSAAIRRAQEIGLDLICIAPTAEPPVAKAMDWGQWQYELKKKQHDAKR